MKVSPSSTKMEALLATNARAREIYRRNCELLSQGKLPPGIIVIEKGEGRKRKMNYPPPDSDNKAKKVKIVDLVDNTAPLVDLTKDEGKEIEVIDLD